MQANLRLTPGNRLLRALVCSGLIAGSFGIFSSVVSASPASPVPVDARVTALESQVSALTMALRTLNQTIARQEARIGALEKDVAGLLTVFASQDEQIASLQAAVVSSEPDSGAEVASLKSLLRHFSREGDDIYITGANLHIVNGTGQTWGTGTESLPEGNALGNLILGYNELPPWDAPRGGSHNLVIGPLHSYSSVGGLVAGAANRLSGAYATVSGGHGNKAEGDFSSVSGGQFNTAKGSFSAVIGGHDNQAAVHGASVSGGSFNSAEGPYSSISGGIFNTASGSYSSITGGGENTASGSGASAGGGYQRTANGNFSWAAGD